MVIDVDPTFIDSTGVAALAHCHERLNACGRRLHAIIVGVQPAVGFDIAG